MNIFSWNINGIRAVEKKGSLGSFIENKNPDIACFQEIKIDATLLSKEDFKDKYNQYYQFYSHADKKGYAGTSIWTKKEPIRVIYNFPKIIIDKYNLVDSFGDITKEGRICGVELEDFWLITVYTPNTKNDLARLKIREQWDKAFLDFIKGLEKGSFKIADFSEKNIQNIKQEDNNISAKPVIFCGDLNVAHQEIDLSNPKQNKGKHGFTNEERAGFSNFIANNLVDIYRKENPTQEGIFTWWSHFAKSRERNIGWRIDYFIISNNIVSTKVNNASIHNDIFGSDHCPISIEVK
ncbi:exodeoxyribonuclease III [Candidatus Nanogingivalis gingivitcus]|jgi:exodeoxyribonuclease III (xth)|uniref:Exodeoxyribonuclease n=1 Tax=Candidatus Nanogingivalis gingivitcus TaxID=2171992 RepID=A0ABY0FHE8_9BACT|nr:exodeoxyribonuclease III [Candidatus Nanogingivalis gingivitcus]RYC72393.1 Exodeoxyribonuclease [Candidatus Nanogingivalis gingivitcus]